MDFCEKNCKGYQDTHRCYADGFCEEYKQYKNKKNMWITESNRTKHFLYAIPIGLVFTILCVLGLAAGMEFKDKSWGGKWDWLDFLATMLGGLVGQMMQILIIVILI